MAEKKTEKKVETPKTEPVKKERKPREKVRSVEELMNLSPSKMTDKEKNKLIKELKEQLNLNNNKFEAYKQTSESAFAQTREIEAKYEAMEAFYRKKLAYVDNQVTAFHASINEALKGGAL